MVNTPTFFFVMGEDMNVVVLNFQNTNVGKKDQGGWGPPPAPPWREDLMNDNVRMQEQQSNSGRYTNRQ